MLGTGDINPLKRLERISRIDHHNDDEAEQKRRRKVQYQGRAWEEGDEEPLPVTPPQMESKPKVSAKGVYANHELLERAEKELARFTTLEEKIGQLCFLEVEAFYDQHIQKLSEELILNYQIGGILFSKGDYKRQGYLVERFQEISKTPLLFGNDLLHGLSFYFQGEVPKEKLLAMSEMHLADLGKAVVSQNRRLGVHFQIDQERVPEKSIKLTDRQARAFRNGIREAQGIVGREKVLKLQEAPSQKEMAPTKNYLSPVLRTDSVQEAYGLRTLYFFEATKMPQEEVLEAFKGSYDAFLLSSNLGEVVKMIASLIKEGKIQEKELDRKLLKILLIKMLFFRLK